MRGFVVVLVVLVAFVYLETFVVNGTMLGKAIYEAEYAGERGKIAADPKKVKPGAKLRKDKRRKRDESGAEEQPSKLKKNMSKLLKKIHNANKQGKPEKFDRKKRFLPVCTKKFDSDLEFGPMLGVCPKHNLKIDDSKED